MGQHSGVHAADKLTYTSKTRPSVECVGSVVISANSGTNTGHWAIIACQQSLPLCPDSVQRALLMWLCNKGQGTWTYPMWYKKEKKESKSESHSVVSDSLQPHRLYSPWILQARILEWVACHFFRGSSRPRDRTQASRTQVASLPAEPPGSPGREEGTCSSLGPLLGPRAGHALTGSCTSHGSLQPEAMPLLASFSGWVEECDSFNKGVSRGPVRGYLGK